MKTEREREKKMTEIEKERDPDSTFFFLDYGTLFFSLNRAVTPFSKHRVNVESFYFSALKKNQ